MMRASPRPILGLSFNYHLKGRWNHNLLNICTRERAPLVHLIAFPIGAKCMHCIPYLYLYGPEDDEEPFTPDDPAIVREQNLRALLVLLPAKVMKNVVKVAMEGAVLHRRRTATADAERRRRSLLSSRAQFRHTMRHPRQVRQPSSESLILAIDVQLCVLSADKK